MRTSASLKTLHEQMIMALISPAQQHRASAAPGIDGDQVRRSPRCDICELSAAREPRDHGVEEDEEAESEDMGAERGDEVPAGEASG
jgi:hypothetical protein